MPIKILFEYTIVVDLKWTVEFREPAQKMNRDGAKRVQAADGGAYRKTRDRNNDFTGN
jgi:hypothetical protein